MAGSANGGDGEATPSTAATTRDLESPSPPGAVAVKLPQTAVPKPTWLPQRLEKWMMSSNSFPSMNHEGTGFDPTNRWLEGLFSQIATIIAYVVLVVSIISALTSDVISTHELSEPSFQAYQSVLSESGLVREPDCLCSSALLPLGTEYGGFVSEVSWSLDGFCDGFQAEVNDTRPEMRENERGPPVERCAEAVVEQLNPGLKAVAGAPHAPWAQCASVQKAFGEAHQDLNRLCRVANTNAVSSQEAFKMGEVVSNFMLSGSEIQQLVEVKLRMLAYQTTTVMLPELANGNAAALTTSLEERGRNRTGGCQRFEVVDGSGSGDSRAALTMCRDGDVWTPRCCGPDECRQVFSLPCSNTMKDLARRLVLTSYGDLNEAIKGGFLKDGQAAKAHLAGNHSGTEAFVLVDDASSIYQRYFDGCKPQKCTYITRHRPTLSYMLSILLGLYGGSLAVGSKFGGYGLKAFKAASKCCLH